VEHLSRGDRPLAHSITFVAQLARNRLYPLVLGHLDCFVALVGGPSGGASQPLDSCHRRKVWPVTSVTARVPGKLLGRTRAPIRSRSLLRFQDAMP
jgi:hypothetical protein